MISGKDTLTAIFVIACVCAFASAAPASPRPGLVNSGYISGSGLGLGGPLTGSVTAGWEFSPQQDIWVTQLGFYDLGKDGLNIFHAVGIWDDGQNLLASVGVPAGSSATLLGEFRYSDIAPIRLTGGRNYVIGATAPTCSVIPPTFYADVYPNHTTEINAASISFDSVIQAICTDRYASDMLGGSPQDPLVYPAGHIPPTPQWDPFTGQPTGNFDYPYLFAPNFTFTEAPEPATLALTALGILLASRWRMNTSHDTHGPAQS